MTEEESKMLRDLHRALMEVPPGSDKDERPLIQDLRLVVRSYKRASWATRTLIWFLPTAALLGAAIQSIWKFFGGVNG